MVTQKYKSTLIYSLYAISLILFYFSGVYWNENSIGGANYDYLTYHFPAVVHFSKLPLSDAIIDYSSASMPLYYMLNGYYNPFLNNEKFYILSHVLLAFFIGFLFFKALHQRYPYLSQVNLVFLSAIIFISPTFKSVTVSPTNDALPYLFFLLSILTYYMYQNNGMKAKYIPIVLFLLILASLTRQYFILLFGFFTFIFMIDHIKSFKRVSLILTYSIILFIPFAYLIYLWGGLTPPSFQHHSSFNLNSIPYIFSSIGLYSTPYLITMLIKRKQVNFNKSEIFIYLLIAIIYLFIFIDFCLYKDGGGLLAKVSQLIAQYSNMKIENYLFLFFSLTGLFFVFYLTTKSWKNIIIIAVPMFFITTEIIYQKYSEPLVPIILLLLINYGKDTSVFFKSNKFILLLFSFHFLLYVISFIYYNLLQ